MRSLLGPGITVAALLATLGTLALSGGQPSSASEPAGKPSAKAPDLSATDPHLNPAPAPEPGAMDHAINRGVRFLLERQNKDGSWGSAHHTKGLNIYAPVPGAHMAFRTGVTALCTMALIEVARTPHAPREDLNRTEREERASRGA